MMRFHAPAAELWHVGRTRRLGILILLVGISWLLPVQAGDVPLPRLFIVGRSQAIITDVLSDASQRPFCYEDFIEQVTPIFDSIPYGSGGRGCLETQTLVNVEQMDCVTFVENMLAMALTTRDAVQRDSASSPWRLFQQYTHHLDSIRFYHGQNCTWDDRIYYYTDALHQLADRGLAIDVGAYAGVPFGKPIRYMTSNPRRFRGIRSWDRIQGLEHRLNQRQRYWFPVDDIASYERVARTGDLIAFVTTIEGLDVSHCGIVHYNGHELAFTHASSLSEHVRIKETLCDYLARRTTIAGIIVFRPYL